MICQLIRPLVHLRADTVEHMSDGHVTSTLDAKANFKRIVASADLHDHLCDQMPDLCVLQDTSPVSGSCLYLDQLQ